MVESPKAGPSRKRSRADENDDGGISQQMERLQLQDMPIKVQIYLSYRLYITVAQPSKNFAAKNSVVVCKYLQKWTMNVNKLNCLVFTKFSNDANMQ